MGLKYIVKGCMLYRTTAMDKKAKDILFKTYWTATGWTNDKNRHLEPADFEYAKSKGLMFDNLTISKPELLKRLGESVSNISLKTITDAFLCGLTSGRCDWRSGLASYANAHHLLRGHNVHEYYFGYGKNIDLNVLNFERIKWGGVRHWQGSYNMLDLELLSKETIPLPTDDDKKQFAQILHEIENADPQETASKLRDRLRDVINISKSERGALLEILGCAGIILPLKFNRKMPSKCDWTFLAQWRGEDKYCEKNCDYYFGSYNLGQYLV